MTRNSIPDDGWPASIAHKDGYVLTREWDEAMPGIIYEDKAWLKDPGYDAETAFFDVMENGRFPTGHTRFTIDAMWDEPQDSEYIGDDGGRSATIIDGQSKRQVLHALRSVTPPWRDGVGAWELVSKRDSRFRGSQIAEYIPENRRRK